MNSERARPVRKFFKEEILGMKAPRNKTIDITVSEGRDYLDRCISVCSEKDLFDVIDRIVLGDAFSVLPFLPDKCADIVIADPPYNMDKRFNGTRFRQMEDDDYEAYTEKWINAVIPKMKDDASIYVCCDWRSSNSVYRVLSKHFKIRNRITWQREKGRGSLKNWKNSMEDIWFATVSDNYTFNIEDVKQRRRVIAPYRENGRPKDWEETEDGRYRNTYPSNFWDDISVPYWSMKENTAHPTQKPEKLMAKLILAGTDPGGLVLDPFSGSGSSAVATKKLGRHFICIEQDDQYCVWAQKRLEMAEEDTAIQGYRDGVFWERNTPPHSMK